MPGFLHSVEHVYSVPKLVDEAVAKQVKQFEEQFAQFELQVGQFEESLQEQYDQFIDTYVIKDLIIACEDPDLVPIRAHPGDAGLDLKASSDITIQPQTSEILGTGVKVVIPENYVGMVYSRSSLGITHKLMLSSSVGVIDSGYRNEIKIPLFNYGTEAVEIHKGDRLAQLVVQRIELPEVTLVDNYDDFHEVYPSERGANGLGSTGSV